MDRLEGATPLLQENFPAFPRRFKQRLADEQGGSGELSVMQCGPCATNRIETIVPDVHMAGEGFPSPKRNFLGSFNAKDGQAVGGGAQVSTPKWG